MTFTFNRTLFARALLAGAAVVALASGAAAQSGEPFKLASITPLSNAGASMGAAQDLAVKLAVKEINAKGGIAGRPVVMVSADTQTDPTVASTEAKRLVFQEKVHAVIGPLVTQEIIPTLSVFTEAKIPQISTTGSAAVTPQLGPYHFSFNNSSDTQSEVMADFAKNTLKAKTIAAIHDDGGQSKAGIVFLREYAKKIGLNLVTEQEYKFRTDDMTPQVLGARRANPDAVLFYTSSLEDTVKLLNGRKDLGWNAPVVGQLSIPTFGVAAARQTGPEAFKGVYGQYYAGLSYCTNDPVGAGEFAKFQTRLEAFAPDAKGKVPVSTALYMYDSVYVMKAAMDGLKKENKPLDGPNFEQWMYKNAGTINDLVTAKGLSPSPQNHFLFGAKAYVMVEDAYKTRSDGVLKRAGC